MSRNQIQRKSTWIDMTPFVDVAFIILTFFIMATKFKPDETVQVKTPSSVSSKELEEKDDTFMILLDKEGKVFGQLSPNLREPVISNMNTTRSLGLTAQETKQFIKSGSVATSIAGLKKYYSLDEAKRSKYNVGIPVDSIGNGELETWIRDVNSLTQGKAQWYIKGDNAAKYPKFKGVLDALKKNEIFKFNLVTSAEPVPQGSELEKIRSNN